MYINITKFAAAFIIAYFVAALIGLIIAALDKKRAKNDFFVLPFCCMVICFMFQIFISFIFVLAKIFIVNCIFLFR